MDFLNRPRRSRSPGYVHGIGANVAETLEAYARGIIRGIHPIDSDQSEAILRALNDWGWDDSLKLYLPFDETSGQSAFDLSGNANTGTATGTTVVSGVFGKARSFDGEDDEVDVGTDSSLTVTDISFSLEVWLKTTSSAEVVVFSKDSSHYCCLVATHLAVRAETHKSGTVAVNDDIWHYATYVIDRLGDTISLFVDGILDVSASYGLGDWPTTQTYIGSRKGSLFFPGYLDEIRFYSRILTADEIYLHYLAGALKLGLI